MWRFRGDRAACCRDPSRCCICKHATCRLVEDGVGKGVRESTERGRRGISRPLLAFLWMRKAGHLSPDPPHEALPRVRVKLMYIRRTDAAQCGPTEGCLGCDVAL